MTANHLGNCLSWPLEIGSLKLPGRALLAPMAGVSDVAMRRLALRFGAGLAVCEMAAAESYLRGDRAARLKAMDTGEGISAVQIAGCDPTRMAEAARLAEGAGAALLDINMGCPVKKVTSGYAGSHLMRDLKLAAVLIRSVIAAVRIPVSLKMRLGWDDSSQNAAALGRIAEAEGVAMLTVHGRTRCQFFAGRADWRAIATVKRSVAIPVVANGDCTNLADVSAMLAQSGADAVMIGRAATGQPWIVGEAAHFIAHAKVRTPLSLAARRSAALEHFETLLVLFGAERGLRHVRKHLAAYAARAGLSEASPIRQRLVRLECPHAVRGELHHLFDQAEEAAA